jgi:hypothetical protein
MFQTEFSSYEPLPYDNDSHQRFNQGINEARFLLQSFGQELQQGQVEKGPSVDPTPMASQGVNVVAEVPLKEASWFKDQAFVRESLRPFLRSLQIDLDNTPVKQQVCIVSQSQTIEKMIPQRSSTLGDSSHQMLEEVKSSSFIYSTAESTSEGSSVTKIRHYQSEQWHERFEELVEFNVGHGHSLVPINWQPNIPLALWVKRQRQQYQLKNKENKHSTLTDERQEALEKLGFVWESRGIAWEEKYAELCAFNELHGHCTIAHYIPKTSPLAIWVKCQRRQFKLFGDNRKSSITPERVARLNALDFDWFPRRKHGKNKKKL